jgi:hypothetical protein
MCGWRVSTRWNEGEGEVGEGEDERYGPFSLKRSGGHLKKKRGKV